MRRIVIVLITVIATAFTVWSAGTSAGAQDQAACADAKRKVTKDVEYVDEPLSDLQRLDVYGFKPSKDCDERPVVMWVHGGGWRRGDKRSPTDKVSLFNGQGYVLVSVNYRLSDPLDDPERPMHPAHAQDVGAAVSWVEDHIGTSAGDGDQIALLGHSAGGHLVSLVGLDPSFIEDSGGEADSVRCVISNDTEGYDIVARTAQGGLVQRLYENAFGSEPTVQAEASPINHVGDRNNPPSFLVITRGGARRVAAANAFADAVEQEGAKVDVLEATGLTHADVNRLMGTPDDTVVTPVVEAFTKECLG